MNPYVSIIRPSVSLMSALGALVGALIAGAGFSVSLPCAIVAVFLISGGGVVLNDYYDIEIDKINAPHRVLPSGSMSKKAAICYSIALFVLGLGFSYLANLHCLALAALNVFLEFLYARNLKRTQLVRRVDIFVWRHADHEFRDGLDGFIAGISREHGKGDIR